MKDVDEKIQWFADVYTADRMLECGAQTHWYFVEAGATFRSGLFLASTLCSFNALESSIRWILKRQEEPPYDGLDPNEILNHGSILKVQALGYRVESLAFPDEKDFLEKIKGAKPRVELNRQRNNICHGNVSEYFQQVPETEDLVFTPECVEGLAENLLQVSMAWMAEVRRFRQEGVALGR